MNLKSAFIAAGVLSAGFAYPFQINEIFFNPDGADNGFEFFEVSGDASASMAGLTFLVIEGDGTGAGVIDQALSLSSLSLGSNGLFLWRDAATVLTPAPHASTTLNVGDFVPDIENGTNTFMIVRDFTGAVTNDLDTNNDGVFDTNPWSAVVDAIGWNDGGAGDQTYGTSLSGLAFTPAALLRLTDGELFAVGVTGANPGQYDFDWTNNEVKFLNSTYGQNDLDINHLTPGNINPTAVPEPATMAALGIVAAAALRRRRKA